MPSKFWNDLKKTLKDGFNVAAEKTEEYTKIGKIKVEILNIKRNIDKAYGDLGKEVFGLLSKGKDEGLSANAKVKEFLCKSKSMTKEINDKEALVEKIKEEHQKANPAAKKPADTPAKPKSSGSKSAPKSSAKK